MGLFHLIIFFILFFLGGLQSSFSQYYNPKCRYTAIGFSIKGSYFHGDIATPLQYVRPGLSVVAVRRVTPRISLATEIMWIRVMGDDFMSSNLQTPNKINTYIRNLHFRNDIKEAAVYLKYDLFPSADHYRKRPIYNLYGVAGISFFYHNPKARVFKDTTMTKTKWLALRPLETENVRYSNFGLAIPIGVGIRYKLSLQWDMEVEVGYRYTFTDYLDDVSGQYPDPASLKDDNSRMLSNRSAEQKSALSKEQRDLEFIQSELGYSIVSGADYKYVQNFGPGNERGTAKGNDGYIIFSIRFLYAIPGIVNCPKFREF
ncbi:MAG: hypothetical protein K2X86_06755 [Cytophagaceae bacterium]|nr:hypothetical protein [Cytophagaceae bacterium]